MMQAILFGTLGSIFLAALLVWAIRREPEERAADSANETTAFFSAFSIRLPSREITNKIFGDEDFEFIQSAASPRVEREYLAARRKLSLLWLGEVRRAVEGLFRLYRTIVRHHVELTPTVELGVLLVFLRFELFAAVFAVLLHLTSPSQTVRLTRSAERQTKKLIALLAFPLGECDTATLERMEVKWRQQQAGI